MITMDHNNDKQGMIAPKAGSLCLWLSLNLSLSTSFFSSSPFPSPLLLLLPHYSLFFLL